MGIGTYFQLLCNYSQNYLLIKTIHLSKKYHNTFLFQTLQLFAVAIYKVSQRKLTFLDTGRPLYPPPSKNVEN